MQTSFPPPPPGPPPRRESIQQQQFPNAQFTIQQMPQQQQQPFPPAASPPRVQQVQTQPRVQQQTTAVAAPAQQQQDSSCCGCNNGCNSKEVPLRHIMRVLGFLIVLLAIIEFPIGGFVYQFWSDLHVGGWWGVILSFIAGVCALFSNTKGHVISACIFASIGFVVSLAATATDGIASAAWSGVYSCAQQTQIPATLFGAQTGSSADAAMGCLIGNNVLPSRCVCAGVGYTSCWGFSLAHQSNNCGDVINTWMPALSVSAAFLSLSTIGLFILSIVSCVSLCNKPRDDDTSKLYAGSQASA